MATNDDEEDGQATEPVEQSDHLIISIPSPRVDEATVIHLPDANIGSTDTDDIAIAERHVTFLLIEQPNQSEHCDVAETQNAEEVNALVKYVPEINVSQVESFPIVDEPTLCLEERSLHNMLNLLHQFTRNLERIEQHISTREANQNPELAPLNDENNHPLSDNLTIEGPQQRDLGTQTSNTNANATGSGRRSLHLNVSTVKSAQKTHTVRSFVARTTGINSRQQQPDNRPPCERTCHTITITPHGATQRPVRNQQRSLLGRIGQSLGDFAAAVCLCLRVNKDCVFCLGFFLAFVVSASFLTAFFYRTLTLSATVVRVPVNTLTTTSSDVVTIHFNGGYYYLYNSQKTQYS